MYWKAGQRMPSYKCHSDSWNNASMHWLGSVKASKELHLHKSCISLFSLSLSLSLSLSITFRSGICWLIFVMQTARVCNLVCKPRNFKGNVSKCDALVNIVSLYKFKGQISSIWESQYVPTISPWIARLFFALSRQDRVGFKRQQTWTWIPAESSHFEFSQVIYTVLHQQVAMSESLIMAELCWA